MTVVLVTGGAGFIGSALVRQLITESDARVVTVDKLTYAGNLRSLGAVADNPRHTFELADVTDQSRMAEIFARYAPDIVMHLAAESHVDRSLDTPALFVDTNLVGTWAMLEAARQHWTDVPARHDVRRCFVHVSSDEVFGALGATGRMDETTRYDPTSPYAATKAGADHLARAWQRSYGLPVIVTNSTNNYGPCQHPEKLIPHTILRALAGKSIPVYGQGEQVRDWLHVDDHARALRAVALRGRIGETYLIGAETERRNIDLVLRICALLDELRPGDDGSYSRLVSFVEDRPGHDFRYALDPARVRTELGWQPRDDFETGLRRTVEWYLANDEWLESVRSRGDRNERLGLLRR